MNSLAKVGYVERAKLTTKKKKNVFFSEASCWCKDLKIMGFGHSLAASHDETWLEVVSHLFSHDTNMLYKMLKRYRFNSASIAFTSSFCLFPLRQKQSNAMPRSKKLCPPNTFGKTG